MKLFPLLYLLALSLVQEGTSTHHETCECHEIRELVNISVQQAAAHLEYKLGIMIDTAISNINTTDETTLSDLENRLTSAIQGLLTPIQTQLDYHLPPPPPTTSASPDTTSATLPVTSAPPSPSGETADDPATSCKDLYHTLNASSGYYWIGEIGSAVRVYCNMSLTCGNLTGGWMRVANIDMTNTSQNCPSGLDLITSPRRLCDTTVNGCASSDFNVHGAQYSHICGRIISYQRRFPTAFYLRQDTIEQVYVNGVSLTHGQSPRQHIWTFVAAGQESSNRPYYTCPCMNTDISPATVPSYMRSDYFCDSALIDYRSVINLDIIHTSDPLWDGEGCNSNNTCCYDPQRGVNPPWFVKTLSSPTSDNIEMRLCQILNSYGGAPIEIVELYVK